LPVEGLNQTVAAWVGAGFILLRSGSRGGEKTSGRFFACVPAKGSNMSLIK